MPPRADRDWDSQPSITSDDTGAPDQITSIRSSFCNQVHYFTSDEDAAGWLAEHPRAEVVPVAVAYRIGTDLTTGFLNQFQANAAVADDGHCRC